MSSETGRAAHSESAHWSLLALVAIALVVGIYARFKGIGTWPLAIDEYYIARSVENVLRVGLPEYDCGGYYTRGVVFQYLAALLQIGGASPELAPRLIAAVSSLLVLPAVYLLGRRLLSPSIGWLAVIILALSVWEIEMSRFGRMYAPFQAVFAWYVVYFVRYCVDEDRRALIWMIALSIFGVLVWEGGALLGLANLLPPLLRRPDGRLLRKDWTYLAGMIALMLPMVYWATNELRYASAIPALPENLDPAAGLEANDSPGSLFSAALSSPMWLGLALVPALVAVPALAWIWRLRERWLLSLGLLAVLMAAALHQLLASVSILLLLLLAGLIHWRELLSRNGLMLAIAVFACTVFWFVIGLAMLDAADLRSIALLGYELVRFPDVIMAIVRPWYRAAPVLGFGLAMLIGFACLRVITTSAPTPTVARALLALLVVLLLAASATDAPRAETRYIYFTYPLIIVLALFAIRELVQRVVKRPHLVAVSTTVAALLAFAASEDFQPYHLRDIDSYQVNFRVDMPSGVASHYHPRSDIRAAGEWLNANAADPQKLIVNGYPGVDFYFRGFDHTYIAREHQRYEAYACERGARERWGSRPLLDSVNDFQPLLAAHGEILIVLPTNDLDTLMPTLQQWHPEVFWSSWDNAVLIVQLRDLRR